MGMAVASVIVEISYISSWKDDNLMYEMNWEDKKKGRNWEYWKEKCLGRKDVGVRTRTHKETLCWERRNELLVGMSKENLNFYFIKLTSWITTYDIKFIIIVINLWIF